MIKINVADGGKEPVVAALRGMVRGRVRLRRTAYGIWGMACVTPDDILDEVIFAQRVLAC